MKWAGFFPLKRDESETGMGGAGRSLGGRVGGWGAVCAGVAFAVAMTCIAQDGRPAASGAASERDSAASVAAIQAGSGANQTAEQKAATADSARKKQIASESTELLAMAVALKAEVDKTNKDVLSMTVIRKADEIEKMARMVKEKMKLTAGAN